ncbi:hypothetical protein [Ralstonia sp. 1B3]|uniref:hypothetical protein n=1 Tax=Ralstonia sp. 1B3 TaxID=2997421 RepID=UPI002FC5C097
MDTARDKRTLALVEAEELWSMATVATDGFICRGCETQVFPASYDKSRNKKRPYFSLGPVNKHESGCDVDGEEKIVKRAKKERVGTPEGFPLPFPSKLTFSDDRPVVPGGAGESEGQVRYKKEAQAGTRAVSGKHHGHTVKTVRPACRAFMNFPFDRGYLPLAIPDVPGNTYANVFWYLGSKKPEFLKAPKHLYYAAIRWTVDPVITETHCELTLNAGEWDKEANGYKSLSRVRINWSHWSQARRDSLIREFEATREEAAEEFRSDSQTKGWIFFVGVQDSVDPEIFLVDDYRLICCLAAKMIWPSKK